MAIKLFEIGFNLVARDYLSPVLKKVEAGLKNINEQVKATASWREAGTNLALIGGGIAAVGAGIALPLKAAFDASDELEDHMARLAVGMGPVADKEKQLAQAGSFIREESVKTGFTMSDLTESLYQGVSGFLSLEQSIAVADRAAVLARATNGNLADTTKELTTLMLNFGDATKSPIQNATILSDKMATLQTRFKFTDLNELTEAMSYAGPAAAAFGIKLDQALGALATLSAGGKVGPEAGAAFREITTEMSKASKKLGFEVFAGANGKGIDLQKTLEGIKQRFGDISQNKQLSARFQEAFGGRAGTDIAILLQHMDKFKDATDALANSTGSADAGFAEFTKRGSLLFDRLNRAIDVVKTDIGDQLGPTIRSIGDVLVPVIKRIDTFIQFHKPIVKFAVTFAAIGAAVAIVAGGVLALVGGFIALASFAPAVAAIVTPIALVGVTISAVGAALITFFPKAAKWAFEGGVHIVMAIARGIRSGGKWVIDAIEGVASKIRSYLPFSPAKEGPLRTLNRVRIVETIADTIKPTPVVTAMRRVAAAAAISATVIGGAPAGAAARGGGIVINQTVHVNAPGGDAASVEAAVLKALAKSKYELKKMVEDAVEQHERTQFS